MRKTAFYRRPGKAGTFTGVKERVIWMIQTRGRPVTGSEIAAVFGVTLQEFNHSAARTLTRGAGHVAKIEASPTWKTEDGITDRHFALVKPPAVVIPQNPKSRLFTKKSFGYCARGLREECIEKAERRARLIKAGLYIDEFEAVL